MSERILFLNPVFTHNIWGGTKLQSEFGYEVEGSDIGECWGIAAHPNGDVTIRDGKYQGVRLSALWKEDAGIFDSEAFERFPLLIKIIDAKEDLSIQVHPNDDYARVHENGSFGKTECWYVLDCDENASLVVGHNANDREELVRMIDEKDWAHFVREIPVKKGDFIQIDPGCVHAIKGGIVLLETQQNSDITYRVYDYDRLWDGKPRELHLRQSKEVITVPAKQAKDAVLHDEIGLQDINKEKMAVVSLFEAKEEQIKPLIACAYYKVSRLLVKGSLTFPWKKSFLLATVVEGSGTIFNQPLKKGDHFIVLAGEEEIVMDGEMKLIVSTV